MSPDTTSGPGPPCAPHDGVEGASAQEDMTMGMQKDDLGRQYFVDVDAAGFAFVRERGSGKSPHGALPVFSTDTHEQAKMLIVTHCRLARDGSGLYRLNNPPQSVQDLGEVSDLLRATYAKLAARAA